jgi:hypothetical protein
MERGTMMKHYLAALLLWALASFPMLAQQGGFTFLEVTQPVDRTQLKDVLLAAHAMDPQVMIFTSDDGYILQIKSTAAVDWRGVIASTGLTVVPGTPDLQARYGAPPQVPMYIPTGDPEGDHARYVTAVAAWNATHPEQQLPPPIPYVNEH